MNALTGRDWRRILRQAPGFIGGLIILLICPLLNAQEYPTKPVRIIVPVGPGGATDILSRTLGKQLTNIWGQAVIVDNRPGGGSNIGFDVAAKAAPDGYTLLMAQPAFTVNVSLYKTLPYDPIRDFSAVCLTASGANVLVVNPSLPVHSVKDLIALAKANPGKLSYVSSGRGTTPHLSGELFKSMAGVDILHVPYKGAGAAANDLISGYVDIAFLSLSSVVGHINAKKLRALAITSVKRSALMPDLPTFAEAGLPGYEVMGWYGVLAPAKTPRAIINRLNADITRALTHPEVVTTLNKFGLDPADPITPEEFTAYLRAEISKWAKVVKESGATAE
jgi:tripartite-type tricarboxylate transporter receptor subunit TctC